MTGVNEQSRAFGAARSVIREIAAYGAARRAEVGAETVYDFSLGNPSVPSPSEVRAAIERALELPSMELHGYTPAAGLPGARAAIAAALERRFAAEVATAHPAAARSSATRADKLPAGGYAGAVDAANGDATADMDVADDTADASGSTATEAIAPVVAGGSDAPTAAGAERTRDTPAAPSAVAGANDLYLTCGAAASLAIVFHALLNPGDEVILIAPYFPEYRVFVEAAGGTCVEVSADPATFQPDAAAIAAAVTPRTRAVVLNSPNNPTGVVYDRAALAALGAALAAREATLGTHITIVSDEPYREIVYNGVEVPWVPAEWRRTLVCYSYSKALSLPGERIGWVLVPPSHPEHDALVAAVAGAGRKLGYVCAPALFQRVVADCERAGVSADVAAYARNRDVLAAGLSEAGYDFVRPDGAFYLWVRAPGGDAVAFCERAREADVLAVPGDAFGCAGWLRVGYCVAPETIERSLPAWQRLAQ